MVWSRVILGNKVRNVGTASPIPTHTRLQHSFHRHSSSVDVLLADTHIFTFPINANLPHNK